MSKGIAVMAAALAAGMLLSACSAPAGTLIEMEMTGSYDDSSPFINEKLFYVSDDAETLALDVSFEMEGESATLEIADNETGQVVWSDTWNGDTAKTDFSVALDDLEKEKDYVVRLTGHGISHARVVITSRDNLAKELERPRHPDRD